MSWIDDINKQLEKNRESLRKKGYDEKKLAKKEGNSNGGKVTSEIHKRSGQLDKLHKDEKRIQSVKDYQHSRTFEERSESIKNGWENGDKTHISNLGKEQGPKNKETLSKYNQDSEHQAKAGSSGGQIGGPIVANRVHHCKYCERDFKTLSYNLYHGEKCKKNPNREIIYKYELVMDGKSYGKFEEKQQIAEYLECSPALISKYMSGKKKDIKGYQIVTL